MENIDKHIAKDVEDLNDPNTSAQRRRHLESELGDLAKWKINHPGDDHDPTALELYCDSEPGAPECKTFDI